MEILNSAQIQQLANFRQLVGPDSKELISNIDRLVEAQRQAEDATAELRKQESANQAVLDEANKTMADAKALFASVEDEKRRFTEVRETVEQQHREREASLSARASALWQLKADLSQHAAELADREAAVADREQKAVAERKLLDEMHAQHDANVAKYRAATAALAAAGG